MSAKQFLLMQPWLTTAQHGNYRRSATLRFNRFLRLRSRFHAWRDNQSVVGLHSFLLSVFLSAKQKRRVHCSSQRCLFLDKSLWCYLQYLGPWSASALCVVGLIIHVMWRKSVQRFSLQSAETLLRPSRWSQDFHRDSPCHQSLCATAVRTEYTKSDCVSVYGV